jgi:hypothetical protein
MLELDCKVHGLLPDPGLSRFLAWQGGGAKIWRPTSSGSQRDHWPLSRNTKLRACRPLQETLSEIDFAVKNSVLTGHEKNEGEDENRDWRAACIPLTLGIRDMWR